MLNDSYLFDAGWLFFAAWTVIVAAVSVAAFGRDFFPRTQLELAQQDQPQETARPAEPHLI
jgi:hypothetical protein